MLVDFFEIQSILAQNRRNHAWVIDLPVGFGFEEVVNLFPANQIIKLEPSVHQNQKTAIINIDDIRELLPSTTVARKNRLFFIIISPEKMNDSAANAMLKNLEEPAKNVVFIFLTEKASALLPTIRSRAQFLRVKTPYVAESWLAIDPKNKIPTLRRQQIDFLARGSIGLMKTLARSQPKLNEKAKKVEIAKRFLSKNRLERLKTVFSLKKSASPRESSDEICRICLEILLKSLETPQKSSKNLTNRVTYAPRTTNDLTFQAIRGIIERCSALEMVLTDINKSNNFNVSLLLAAQYVV